MSLEYRTVSLLGACVIVLACSEHDPELERVGGTPGAGGSVGDSGTGGGQAGGDGGCVTPSLSKPTLPCDVEAVLKAKCQRCHNNPTKNGAPFQLLAWEDTQVDFFGKPVFERMFKVVDIDFMPYTGLALVPPVESLTAPEKKTLLDWLACATPVEDAVCP